MPGIGVMRVVQPIRVLTGEADIDITAKVYTGWVELMTIANVSNRYVIEDAVLLLDLDKATTGFVTIHDSAETVQFAIARKVDGTNYRRGIGENLSPVGETTAVNATNAASGMIEIRIGHIAPNEDVQIQIILSAENADAEIPYSLTYRGPKPTITAVAA